MAAPYPIDHLNAEKKSRARIPFDTRAYTPNFLPSGFVLFAVGAAAIFGGLYIVGKGNHQKRERERESRSMHQFILPVLQSEADRELSEYLWVRKLYEDAYLEELVRSDPTALDRFQVSSAPGWRVTQPIYNYRFVPPYETMGTHA